MLQRVGMAQALINDPELVFLDEPMSGLDPPSATKCGDYSLASKQGKTIFFNSHILSEVEQICSRVVLAQGELICSGCLDELLGRAETYHVKGRGDLNALNQSISNLKEEQDGSWYTTTR